MQTTSQVDQPVPATDAAGPVTLTIDHPHGSLVLESVTPSQSAKDSPRTRDLPPEWLFYGIEKGEQLAVLCEEHRVQIVMGFPFTPERAGHLFLHDSPNTGRIMRIVFMDYHGPDAGEVIRDARLWMHYAP